MPICAGQSLMALRLNKSVSGCNALSGAEKCLSDFVRFCSGARQKCILFRDSLVKALQVQDVSRKQVK